MRVAIILFLLLTTGFGWALWQGIDFAADRLEMASSEDVDVPLPDHVTLTAPETVLATSEGTLAAVPEETRSAVPEQRGTRLAVPAAAEAPMPAAGERATARTETDTGNTSAVAEQPVQEMPSDTGVVTTAVPSVRLTAVPSSEARIEADVRHVSGDGVNLRQGPTVGTASLGFLSLNDSVEVLEDKGDWALVRTEGGDEGWVSAQYLRPASN